MKIIQADIFGVEPLRGVMLNFGDDGIGPGLVAIVGPTGSGKSTMMDCLTTGPLFRMSAAYGDSIFDHMRDEARLCVVYEIAGQRVSCDLQKAGKKRTAMLHVDGELVGGPLLTSFDEGIAKLFIDRRTFEATAYAVQDGGGSFFSLSPAERKAVFSRMLGIDRYDHWLVNARMEHGKVKGELERLDATIEGIQAEIGDDGDIEMVIGQRTSALNQRRQHYAGLEKLRDQHLEKVQALQRVADEEREAHLKAIEEMNELERDYEAQILDVRRLQERLEGCDVASIETPPPGAVESMMHEEENAMVLAQALHGRYMKAKDLYVKTKRSMDEAYRAVMDSERQHRDSMEAMEREVEELDKVIGALGEVDVTIAICSQCPLTAHARTAIQRKAKIAEDAARLDDEYQERQQGLRRQQNLVGMKLQEQEQGNQPIWLTLEREVEAENLKVQEIKGRRIELLKQIRMASENEKAIEEATRIRQKISDAQKAMAILDKDIDAAREATEKQKLKSFKAQKAVSDIRSGECNDHHQRALDDARSEIEQAEQELNRLQRRAGAVDAAKKRLADAAEARGGLQGDFDASRALVDGLGLVRTAEMAAAGPAISEDATGRLADFDGGRLAISLDTHAEKKSGGEKEVFAPYLVYGDGRVATKGSGGETSLGDEALRGAILTYLAGRDGVDIRTVWRDETSGKLDPIAAAHYVRMLRRLLNEAALHQVIFVSHSESVWREADRIVTIRDGRVEVQ